MQYTLLAKDKNSEARCGVLTTAHGEIHTPVFMPVGTVGSVKAVHMRELKEDIRASGEYLPSLFTTGNRNSAGSRRIAPF